MDPMYSEQLLEMGVSLTELAVKGTASAITRKIRAIRDVKDAEKLRTTYEELINEVLYEREEAVRIAQAYKAELDRIVISDEDIEHLHNTISRLLDLLRQFSPDMPVDSFETVKDLISVDTLKTMQLLGFNFKAAIGEPLTKLCAESINAWRGKGKSSNSNKQSGRH